MIDKSKTYRTRDGREVRIYATDGGNAYKVHGAVCDNGQWLSQVWLANGSCSFNYQQDVDLIEVRPRIKRTVWLNVYPANEYSAYENRHEADEVSYHRLACVKVEIDCEEGEGL